MPGGKRLEAGGSRLAKRRDVHSIRREGPPLGCLAHLCNCTATNRRWARYHGAVRNRGFRAAYVIQNGCRSIPASAGAVFIGGDDTFKLGLDAARLVRRAKAAGLWVHMGRVNTLRRLRYAALIGCDSVDGTTLAWGPDRNLPSLLRWIHPAQPSMFGGVA